MTTILLIDLSSIAHPLWHTTQGSSNPNECSIATVAKVRALASGQPHVAVCCDSGRSFRRDVDPTYKAQRPESDATLQHQIALAIETLKADGFPCWAVKGFEADDLLATAVKHYTDALPVSLDRGDVAFVIASSDKDMFQLVSDRVSVHRVADTKKALTVTPEVVRAEYGIDPNQMTEWLMLVGDLSDNIKGAKGIGPKTASAMLTRFGNLADFYAAFDKDQSLFLPATISSMTEFRPRMDTVRQLVTLRTDVPLPFEEVFRERVPCDVAAFGEESDGAENMAGHREGGNGSATVDGPATEGHRDSVPAAQASAGDGGTRRIDQGTGTDSNHASAAAGTAAGVPAPSGRTEQSSASDIRSGASAGLAVRDAEVLPPPSTDVRWQLEPRSMDQASIHAKRLFDSKIFSQFGTPQAVYAIVTRGRELGIPSVAALMAFHNIDNKPCPSADTMQSLVNVSGKVKFFRCKERTPTRATFVTQRMEDDEPTSLTYTIEEAQASWKKSKQAWDNSNWGNIGSSADMCVARAKAKLCRLVCPEAVLGLYAPEEFD